MKRNDDGKNLLFPSRHHYLLVHHAVRGACMSDPMRFIDAMTSPRMRDMLENLWDQVCIRCSHCESPSFGINDVALTNCTVGGQTAVVVIMPPPEGVGEAHFVGIVLALDGQKMERYYTLERAKDGGTVLCEWTPEGCHLNHGHGPRAEVGEFVRAMEAMIRKI